MAAKMMLVMACVVLFASVVGRVASKSPSFPALIVFGDSIVDPGNNNYITSIVRSNFAPYGRDFEGGVPTGRFTNGKAPSDLLAEALGIKELVPPYLDQSLTIDELVTGVSFGSGGAGYDPISGQLWGDLNLENQLNLFREYKETLRARIGDNETESLISKSLYLIVAGSNDIANTYYSTPLRQFNYDAESYADFLVSMASTFFQELQELGARHIGVASAPPVGCLPTERTLAGGLFRGCVDQYNELASLYNSKLESEIKRIGSHLIYLDIYNPLLDLINNPGGYGFQVVDRGCCGTGLVEVSFLCPPFGPLLCADASQYVFFDSFHPTENAYRLLVTDIVNRNFS